MANEASSSQPADGDEQNQQQQDEDEGVYDGDSDEAEEDSDSDSDEDEEEEEEDEDKDDEEKKGGSYSYSAADPSYKDEEEEEDRSPESVIRRFIQVVDRKFQEEKEKEQEQEREKEKTKKKDVFNFPEDEEDWREEDLRELWADGPLFGTKPGWDPVWADDKDWEIVKEEINSGRDTPIAPFYLPYRKFLPVVPNNHHDISKPKAVIEELDRIEEFLIWVSLIFSDGSSYEGTVWDDLAHGKGVYVAEQGLVRYEGEWLRNEMEGHGVVEVEIPGVEPVPGSKLEAKMRAEGRIISRDFMSPEDKKWLEMDIEDSILLAGNRREIPFYERKEWLKVFRQKPEKGRYRYAGQWKHGRMHGCGVYEVNERIIYGRFYFGEHLDDTTGCDSDVSALHAGIAEVAAAKARMFINKPDGMVREERGPYGDPQHPYFYEEEDVWMAPGFVNHFYEVPDYWKTYVQEVDQEREMWLNSFYKAPLRIPMPAELEYWWSKDEEPEFVLINKDPEPDPEDPSKLIYTEDPLILHTPTGMLINFVEDEEHGVRLFWQPHLEEGEDVDPEKAEFLPLGFDEFYGKAATGVKRKSRLGSVITSMQNKLKVLFDRLDNWIEEKKKATEMNRKLIENELELIEAEICLEEALEDMENALKMKQKEEEKRSVIENDNDQVSAEAGQDEADAEDEEEDEGAPANFGTVGQGEIDEGEDKSRKSPFSSLSMSLASYTPVSMVPSKLQEFFVSWKKGRSLSTDISSPWEVVKLSGQCQENIGMVKFSCSQGPRANIRAVVQARKGCCKRNSGYHQLNSLARVLLSQRGCKSTEVSLAKERSGGCDLYDKGLSILSLHVPLSGIFAPS